MRVYPAGQEMTLHGTTVDVPDLPNLPTPDLVEKMEEVHLEIVEWDAIALARGAQDEEDYWAFAALNLLDHPDPLRPDATKAVFLLPEQALQTYVSE